MKLFSDVVQSLVQSYKNFVAEVNPNSYEWEEWGEEKPKKDSNPVTYDRYDPKYGLHKEPKKEVDSTEK